MEPSNQQPETDPIRNERIRQAIDSAHPLVASALRMDTQNSNDPVPIAAISLSCKGANFVEEYLPNVPVEEVGGVFHINLQLFKAIHSCMARGASRQELESKSDRYDMPPKLSHSDGSIMIHRRSIRAKNEEVRYDPQFTYRKTIQGHEIFFPVGTNGHRGLSNARKIKKAIQASMPLIEILQNFHAQSNLLKRLEKSRESKESNSIPQPVVQKGILLKIAVRDYLSVKNKSGVTDNTYGQARDLLKRLKKHFGDEQLIETIGTKDVSTYLETLPTGSYNNHLRAVKGIFKWAFESKLIAENPCVCLKARKRPHQDVAILSNEEAENLLTAAAHLLNGELLAYAAITLLAGLRPESEMKMINWADVNLEDSEIIVRKGKRCTPRTIDMPSNLVLFLEKCDQSKPIYPDKFRKKWSLIRVAAGFKSGMASYKMQKKADAPRKPWVRDYTRHTAISNHLRLSGDIYKTATWAGNSPGIIKAHYHGHVTKSDAKKYLGIVPSLKMTDPKYKKSEYTPKIVAH